MYRKIVFLLSVIFIAKSIEIPNKVCVSPESSIVMEPETLAFHYDDVYYKTIGIKIRPAIDNKALQEMADSLCTLGPIRLNVSSALGTAIDSLFNHFSTQFSSLDTHICKSTEIDCFLSKDFATLQLKWWGEYGNSNEREKVFRSGTSSDRRTISYGSWDLHLHFP